MSSIHIDQHSFLEQSNPLTHDYMCPLFSGIECNRVILDYVTGKLEIRGGCGKGSLPSKMHFESSPSYYQDLCPRITKYMDKDKAVGSVTSSNILTVEYVNKLKKHIKIVSGEVKTN